MPSTTTMAGALLLAGIAAASSPLAVLDVCSACNKGPQTVTAQHQAISTCVPISTSCVAASCSTSYSYRTSAYVSSVIPCAWDGTTISSCTVTKTDQAIPCSVSKSTISSVVPSVTGITTSDGKVLTKTSYSTSFKTISKEWNAAYNKLGPDAIPGYDGCDLCTDCGANDDGTQKQDFDVTECDSSDSGKAVCKRYPENRVSTRSAPGKSTPVSAINSVKTSVRSAGSYTFTFTNTAPAATITHNGQKITIPPRPWFNYETRSFNRAGQVDFTVTVVKTVYVHAPFPTRTGTARPVDPTGAFRHFSPPSQPKASGPQGGSSQPQVTSPPSGPSFNGRPFGRPGWGGRRPWWAGPRPGGRPSGGQPFGGRPFGGQPSGSQSSDPSDYPFVVPVNTGSGSKYQKNSNDYIGFPHGGDDAGVVQGRENAAKFTFDAEGNLKFGNKFVMTSTNAGHMVFELAPSKPQGPKFSVGDDGSFQLPGARFCSTGSTFFIVFSSSPNGCALAAAKVDGKSSIFPSPPNDVPYTC